VKLEGQILPFRLVAETDRAHELSDQTLTSAPAYLRLTRDRVIVMVIGRRNRRAARPPRARELFGENTDAALDLLELLELAWHDSYAEVSPPDEVIEDVWIVSGATPEARSGGETCGGGLS
jgi:hypothetical protein